MTQLAAARVRCDVDLLLGRPTGESSASSMLPGSPQHRKRARSFDGRSAAGIYHCISAAS